LKAKYILVATFRTKWKKIDIQQNATNSMGKLIHDTDILQVESREDAIILEKKQVLFFFFEPLSFLHPNLQIKLKLPSLVKAKCIECMMCYEQLPDFLKYKTNSPLWQVQCTVC